MKITLTMNKERCVHHSSSPGEAGLQCSDRFHWYSEMPEADYLIKKRSNFTYSFGPQSKGSHLAMTSLNSRIPAQLEGGDIPWQEMGTDVCTLVTPLLL